jgi:DNA-binding XRE family transcriptional regulator
VQYERYSYFNPGDQQIAVKDCICDNPFCAAGSFRKIFILGDAAIMKLREIRKESGLSVAELSRQSGVPVRTIEDLEKRGDGRVSTLIKLADALNVSLDDLCR